MIDWLAAARTKYQGCQICHPNWVRMPQMGQIWDFLRSVSVHFGAMRQNALKLILKSHRFVQFESNLTHFGPTSGDRTSHLAAVLAKRDNNGGDFSDDMTQSPLHHIELWAGGCHPNYLLKSRPIVCLSYQDNGLTQGQGCLHSPQIRSGCPQIWGQMWDFLRSI